MVPSCQCRGSSTGRGVGCSSISAQPMGAMAVGCEMSLKWQLLVQPFLAMATLYLEEASEVVSKDASVLLLRGMGGLCGAPTLCPPLSLPGWQQAGGDMPHSGWTQTRLQPCRQHLWPRGQSLSDRHRRRHLAA